MDKKHKKQTRPSPLPRRGFKFLDPPWKPLRLVLSPWVATNRGWDESGNLGSPVRLLPSGGLQLSDKFCKQRSQHFPGSRWLPQSLTGGKEQLGDMMMEHLANIQRMMTAASVTHCRVLWIPGDGRMEMSPHSRSSP